MKGLKFITKTAIALLTILVAIVFFGCHNPKKINEGEKFDNRKFTKYISYGRNIEIVEIDSCEYLYCYNYNSTWMTHKGNCKFCVKRSKKTDATLN